MASWGMFEAGGRLLAARLSTARIISGSEGDDELIGTASPDSLFGGDGNDFLEGAGGIDVLDGDSGDDTLVGEELLGGDGNDHLVITSSVGTAAGGAGDDTYYVDRTQTASDGALVFQELPEQGTDLVISYGGTVDLFLMPNIENIRLEGVTRSTAIGNDSDNVIIGNSASNTLDGSAGLDRLIGKGGNDRYTLDDPGDVVVETANQGRDTVRALFTYALGTNLENLTLIGALAIDGTGNGGANQMFGNSFSNRLSGQGGNDTLNGNGGLDTLAGGTGDDLYRQDSVTDVAGSLTFDTITESAGGGIDTVITSSDLGRFTYVLDRNVENLTVLGGNGFRLFGNALDNVLTGNNAGNILDGFGGHDTLIGGTGADQFWFKELSEATSDVIVGFTHLVDRIAISAAGFGGVLTEGGGVFLATGEIPVPAFEGVPTFLYSTVTGQLSFDADGTDPGLAVLVAVLPEQPTLTEADFLVIA